MVDEAVADAAAVVEVDLDPHSPPCRGEAPKRRGLQPSASEADMIAEPPTVPCQRRLCEIADGVGARPQESGVLDAIARLGGALARLGDASWRAG